MLFHHMLHGKVVPMGIDAKMGDHTAAKLQTSGKYSAASGFFAKILEILALKFFTAFVILFVRVLDHSLIIFAM